MSEGKFSASDARPIVGDLFEHNPSIYWVDFLVSITLGYGCAITYFNPEVSLPLRVVCFIICGFALYRVALQMHEIVHMSGRRMLSFRVAWNILAGIPMLMPSYFYEGHLDHHTARHYGTGQDGEYLPLGNGPWRNTVFFFLQVFLQPGVVVFRFLILGPISLLHPRLRQWTLEHMSSFVMNIHYRRRIPKTANRAAWAAMDIACFLRTAAMVGLAVAGLTPAERIPQLYSIAIFILALNYIRTLAAHHYRSVGEPISVALQLEDSVNITGGPVLTELLCPVGLRYHALHHVYPTLPYHNLGTAHRRLMAKLPADSPYRETVYPSYWAVMRTLVHDVRQASGADPTGADLWFARRRQQLDATSVPATNRGASTEPPVASSHR